MLVNKDIISSVQSFTENRLFFCRNLLSVGFFRNAGGTPIQSLYKKNKLRRAYFNNNITAIINDIIENTIINNEAQS